MESDLNWFQAMTCRQTYQYRKSVNDDTGTKDSAPYPFDKEGEKTQKPTSNVMASKIFPLRTS